VFLCRAIEEPLRTIKDLTYLQAECEAVDTTTQSVPCKDPFSGERFAIPYNYLVSRRRHRHRQRRRRRRVQATSVLSAAAPFCALAASSGRGGEGGVQEGRGAALSASSSQKEEDEKRTAKQSWRRRATNGRVNSRRACSSHRRLRPAANRNKPKTRRHLPPVPVL
jgi:hypothetical protein